MLQVRRSVNVAILPQKLPILAWHAGATGGGDEEGFVGEGAVVVPDVGLEEVEDGLVVVLEEAVTVGTEVGTEDVGTVDADVLATEVVEVVDGVMLVEVDVELCPGLPSDLYQFFWSSPKHSLHGYQHY